MQKLFILLKYGLKGANSWGKKKKNIAGFKIVLSYLFFLFFIGFMSFSFKELFFQIKYIDLSLYKLMGYYSLLVLSVMGLFNLIPFFIFAFFKNQEVEFLLTLPIKRAYLYIYQLILTLKDNFLFIGTLFAVFIGYALTYSSSLVSVLYYIFIGLVYEIDLIFVSIFFSLIFSRLLSKKVARYIAYIFMFLIVILFIFILQFRVQIMIFFKTSQNITKIYSFFYRLKFLYSDFNPVKVLINSINSGLNFLYLFIFTVIGVYLSYLTLNSIKYSNFYKISNNINKPFKFKIVRTGSKAISLIKKDLLLVIRNEKAVFMLLYPLLFGIVYSIALKSLYGALFLSISISAFYTITFSIMLIFEDLKTRNITFTLPVKLDEMLMYKLIIPVLYNLFVSIIILLFFIIILNGNINLLLLIPFIFVISLFSSFIGMYIVSKKGTKIDYKYPEKVLNFGITLFLEFIIFLLTFIIVQIPALVLNKDKNLLTIFSINFIYKLLAYILPLLFSVIIIFFVVKNIKNISKKKFE